MAAKVMDGSWKSLQISDSEQEETGKLFFTHDHLLYTNKKKTKLLSLQP
jgi:hypothetical protein